MELQKNITLSTLGTLVTLDTLVTLGAPGAYCLPRNDWFLIIIFAPAIPLYIIKWTLWRAC